MNPRLNQSNKIYCNMPELPEVETTVKDLNKKIKGLKIQDVWTDWAKMIKNPKDFNTFKKEIVGEKIRKVERRGKNILFRLNSKTLLIHQKLTGHLLIGKWTLKNKEWKSNNGYLKEKVNQYIHLMFYLSGSAKGKVNKMLGLSDLRKFGKVLVIDSKSLENLEDIKNLGPEPLDKKFTFNKFKEVLKNKRGKIKQVLMNQTVIAGIGNIYSDEILFEAKIHPLKDTQKLKEDDLKRIYQAMKKILRRAIVLRGDSTRDYRDTAGKKGRYQEIQKVYQQEGEECYRCKSKIKRIKIGGRSAHFCPSCQKL